MSTGRGAPSGAPNPANIPEELRALDQWVCWRYEQADGRPEPTKVLKTVAGHNASSTDRRTWTSIENVLQAADRFDGIGFVFADTDPFAGIDLDECFDEHGELHPDANRIVETLNSYTERSPSRTGLHIIVRASLNGHPRNRTDDVPWGGEDGKIEIYDRARYFTITGAAL